MLSREELVLLTKLLARFRDDLISDLDRRETENVIAIVEAVLDEQDEALVLWSGDE